MPAGKNVLSEFRMPSYLASRFVVTILGGGLNWSWEGYCWWVKMTKQLFRRAHRLFIQRVVLVLTIPSTQWIPILSMYFGIQCRYLNWDFNVQNKLALCTTNMTRNVCITKLLTKEKIDEEYVPYTLFG